MEDAHNMIKVKFLVKRDIINYYTNKQKCNRGVWCWSNVLILTVADLNCLQNFHIQLVLYRTTGSDFLHRTSSAGSLGFYSCSLMLYRFVRDQWTTDHTANKNSSKHAHKIFNFFISFYATECSRIVWKCTTLITRLIAINK